MKSLRMPGRGLPRTIWMLGLVSLFMDMSSEIIHSLLPLFLVSTLGASMTSLGLIEGMAEATAQITKVFSGTLSDYLGKRKFLLLLGYGLAAFSKFLFPLAQSVSLVFAARFLDRMGKGIRGAPRDALVADVTPPSQRGAAFGLRQSLDTIGAFLGPLLAIGFLWLSQNQLRLVLWIAVLPALFAVSFLFLCIHEPAVALSRPSSLFKSFQINRAFAGTLILGGALTLARFSEAFLVLRAHEAGLGTTLIPLVILLMSLIYALSAYPAGLLADHFSPRILLILGVVSLILADCILACTTHIAGVMLGIGIWGLHMGLTQGLLSAMVAETASPQAYGASFGIFNLVCGLLTLAASALAGFLWQGWGYQAAFYTSGAFALLCLIGLIAKKGSGRFRSDRP